MLEPVHFCCGLHQPLFPGIAGQRCCTYPIFLENLPKGYNLCTDKSLKMLYVIAALQDVSLESRKPALTLSGYGRGSRVGAPRDKAAEVV